ncbi:BglG family transcription antiterminator [Salibacterium aidingense]|uniref:BglG family transcription antiterminator n=1 Tax=Salibacterium aidingense TaxID=384933 RepID=UPI003BC99436
MVLDKRRVSLLHYLYQQNNEIKMEKLKDQFGVSQRTLYYDLDQINGWLKQEQLEPIQKSYGKGFFLTEKTIEELPEKLTLQNEWDYRFSPNERRHLTTLTLLTQTKPSTVQHLKENVQVSRGTMFRDLNRISKCMDDRGLSLTHTKRGYEIHGNEKIKRQVMNDTISSLLHFTNNEHVNKKLNDILYPSANHQDASLTALLKKEITAIETALDVSFTEEVFRLLTLQIMIAVKRKSQELSLSIEEEEIKILKNTEAFQSLQKLNNNLLHEGFSSLPDEELYLLTIQILGARVHYEQLSGSNRKEMEQLKMVIRKIVDDFQLAACIVFEERKQLEDNLFLHLKPTYYRLKYDLTLNNQYFNDVQAHYPDIYYLTKHSLSHLESFIGKAIPEEEIAYIAMHFGGWLRRENQTSVKKFKGIVVCENGIAASGMVRAQIETIIPEIMITHTLSIREYNEKHIEADIVFSTSFIKQKQAPIVYLPTILNEKERETVISQTQEYLQQPEAPVHYETEELINVIAQYAAIHDKHALQDKLYRFLSNNHSFKKETYKPMLDELLTSRTIRFESSAADWEEAVRMASAPLLNNENIQENYVEAMIQNVKENGPYVVIAPNIALPHARPEEGVDRLGMSLLHLKEPVFFSEQEKHKAFLVIVLAAIDNETHLQALSQLTEMLSDSGNTEHLLKAEAVDEILALVQQYSIRGGR